MKREGIILGVIIAFDLDRNGNDYVIRGSLEFFNKPLIKITDELLEKTNIQNVVVYTNQKGIVFKNILRKKVKYIVRKNNYLYTSNSLLMDFDDVLKNVDHILFIDPKYPLLDDILISELIEKHKQNNSDLTYIKGNSLSFEQVPNIFVIDKKFFVEVFVNEFYPKIIEINKLLQIANSLQKNLNFIETVYVYKVLSISNGKLLSSLESLLMNRK